MVLAPFFDTEIIHFDLFLGICHESVGKNEVDSKVLDPYNEASDQIIECEGEELI